MTRACFALYCTGQHCASCGRDIVGGYPGLDGKPVCYDCPNLAKGTYHVTVEVMASSAHRAKQTAEYAIADWYAKSDSNARIVNVDTKRTPGEPL